MTACHAPGSLLGTRDMAVNQTCKFSALIELLFYMGQAGERRKLVRSKKKIRNASWQIIFCFIYLFILRESERGTERGSQAGSVLSVQSPK